MVKGRHRHGLQGSVFLARPKLDPAIRLRRMVSEADFLFGDIAPEGRLPVMPGDPSQPYHSCFVSLPIVGVKAARPVTSSRGRESHASHALSPSNFGRRGAFWLAAGGERSSSTSASQVPCYGQGLHSVSPPGGQAMLLLSQVFAGQPA